MLSHTGTFNELTMSSTSGSTALASPSPKLHLGGGHSQRRLPHSGQSCARHWAPGAAEDTHTETRLASSGEKMVRASVRRVKPPTDTKTFLRDLAGYAKPTASEASFFGSFMGFARHMAPPPADLTCSTNTVFGVSPTPLGRGAEHYVYHAAAWHGVTATVQDAMCTSLDAFVSLDADEAAHMVVKVPRVVQDPGFAESKMAVHVPATESKVAPSTHDVQLAAPDPEHVRQVASHAVHVALASANLPLGHAPRHAPSSK